MGYSNEQLEEAMAEGLPLEGMLGTIEHGDYNTNMDNIRATMEEMKNKKLEEYIAENGMPEMEASLSKEEVEKSLDKYYANLSSTLAAKGASSPSRSARRIISKEFGGKTFSERFKAKGKK